MTVRGFSADAEVCAAYIIYVAPYFDVTGQNIPAAQTMPTVKVG